MKKLAGGLVVLPDVGFGLGTKLQAKDFLGASLAKTKGPRKKPALLICF